VSCNVRCWYFYVYFVYFTIKWYILGSFSAFGAHVVYIFSNFGAENNMATLSAAATRLQLYIATQFGMRQHDFSSGNQGCQMVRFQTENPNLGKFCRALE
jgi:hypothetical protein